MWKRENDRGIAREVKSRPIAVFAIRQIRRNTGAVRNVLEQAEYIQGMGYEVKICAERANRARLAEYGFQWVRIPRLPVKGYVRRVFFDWCVRRYIRRNAPALFISHGDACSDDILVMHNCNALAHECLYGRPPPENDELARFHRRVIENSRFRYLIANSELMRRDLVERYALKPSRVGVFYQGVDTEIFNIRNHEALRQQGRRLLQLPDRAYVVGLITSGAFHKRNVRFFLEVAANVRTRLPGVRFAVVGKDSEVEWYKNYARQLGVGGEVVFAAPVDDVQAYFHALDIFVYPARIEEYGRVVLEALACGIPAVVGAAVGASEIMERGKVPTVLEGWEVEQWAHEIVSHAKQPVKAEVNAQAGVALAEKYSQINRARAMRALLTQLAGKP